MGEWRGREPGNRFRSSRSEGRAIVRAWRRMESEVGQPRVSPPHVGAPPGSLPFENPFSRAGNVFAAFILTMALGSVLWLSATLPKLDRIAEPEQALGLMVGRTMDVEEGVKRAPPWEQALYKAVAGGNESERTQSLEWYQELVASSDDPLVRFNLAVLQGEAGRSPEVVGTIEGWQGKNGPAGETLSHIIKAAYLGAPLDHDAATALQAELAELVPAGWFYDRVAVRLAERVGDRSFLAMVEDQSAERGRRLLARTRLVAVVELTCLGFGTAALLALWRRRVHQIRLHAPGVPPPWPGGIGAAVLLRGGAVGALLSLAFLFLLPAENLAVRMLAVPLGNLPLLLLARRYLLQPSGMTFREGFGLGVPARNTGRLLLAVLAVVAAGLWGEWIMGKVVAPLNLSSHWTEWFDTDLVWAPGSVLAISLVEYVIFAPVFEELVFRGLLFAILRRRFQWVPAAMISAGIFAIAHGYGLVGFVSVFWSGVLWSWAYEKTGSLLPGMIAHALNNLLVCLSVMALLR